MPPPCIVVATDFSDASRKAVDAAAAIARDTKADLVLVHALVPPSHHRSRLGTDPIGRLEQEINMEDALRFHEEWAQPLREEGFTVRTLVKEGKAPDVILEAAAQEEAALIVLGRQGWGRLERLRFGSVTRKVAERSRVPVVLVPFHTRD